MVDKRATIRRFRPGAIDPPRPGVRWDLPATLAILAVNESTAAGGGAFSVDKLMRGQDD